MSDDLKLGQLIEEKRDNDAVHVAIMPVIAGQTLYPGQKIMVKVAKKKYLAFCENEGAHCGVVDPFLMENVNEGEEFWLLLTPGSITSLRHDWTHPLFPSTNSVKSSAQLKSEQWLRQYCKDYAGNYDQVLEAAINQGQYCFGDDDGPPGSQGITEEFWHHIENIAGKKFDESHREKTYFRCAC